MKSARPLQSRLVPLKLFLKKLEAALADMMNSGVRTVSLEDELLAAQLRSRGGRLQRIARSPIKMIWPVLMRRLGLSRNVTARTFWGGKFSGVLPEYVSTVIWRNGFFDYSVSMTLLRYLQPGSTFVDIGAHFGFFSLLASHLVGPTGKVISIEAMPQSFALLRKNLEANCRHANAMLHQGAAFDRETELQFIDFGLVASSLNSAFGSRTSSVVAKPKEVTVQARPTDDILRDFGASQVDLVKIDAESSEKFVLAGMTGTIERDHPVIVMEVGDIGVENGTPSAELIAFLSERGYAAFSWHDKDLRPFVNDGPVAYDNLVFVHGSASGRRAGSAASRR